MTLDAQGDLFIADAWNNRVRMVPAVSGTYFGQAMTAGDIYTVAGTGDKGFSGDHGPGPAAELSFPTGVAVTPAGNLMIGDTYDNRIREVAVAVAG